MSYSDDRPVTQSEAEPTIAGSEISYALRDLSIAFRMYDRGLAQRMHLKPMEYQAMEHIIGGGGALGPVELAARLGLAVGTTSELLDRLQLLGHVVRDRDVNDGRRVKLAPTRSTTAAIIAAITPASTELDRLAAGYDPAEQEVVLRFLRDVRAGLRSHTPAAER